jgi:hypothetical protein
VKYQPTLQTASSGEARFDHDPVTGESKGLLIEESRVNYITSSENVAGSGGEAGNDGYISNIAVAPDGTLTADKLLQTDGTSSRQRRYDLSGFSTVNQTVTASVYVKSDGSWQYAMVMLSDNSSRRSSVTVDLDTGEITDAGPTGSGAGLYDSSSVEDVGNGWYRISLTGRSATGDTQYYLNVGMSNTGTPSGKDYPIFTGNRYKGILVWGKQLEQGAFPTSYIPTSGSTVTRSGDRANMSLSGVYSSGPVSMYVEAAEAGDVDYARLVLLSDTTNNNRMQITISESSGDVQAFVETNDVAETSLNRSFDPAYKTFFKAAAAFDRDNVAITAGGLTTVSDTSVITPQVTNLYLGSLNDADADSGATFKKVALYPTRLSNATLQAMTEE